MYDDDVPKATFVSFLNRHTHIPSAFFKLSGIFLAAVLAPETEENRINQETT